jgi:polyphosphate kinase 2 (PPK2 family)
MKQTPVFEQMLVEDGIELIKFWFSVTRGEQRTRFTLRRVDPVKQWKLSPLDLASLDKWDAYTEAKERMFRSTHTRHAPWTVVKSNDKKRARLAAMRHVLSLYDYDEKDTELVAEPDPLILGPASRIFEQGEAVGRQFPPL